MYEFEDVNTADIRYLIGVPLLFAAITVLPQLALMPQGKAPRISLIVISLLGFSGVPVFPLTSPVELTFV